MKYLFAAFFSILTLAFLGAQDKVESTKRITSSVDSSRAGELVLIQEFEVNVPVEKAWEAYSTKAGWESVFTALAEVDFRINGTIKTNYNKSGTIGDSSTIILHIINYVPNRLLTLQAELTNNFPAFMKEDAKNLYNVISFESQGPAKTKITSFGIGYRNNPKYLSLMKFFISGNERSYLNLINYLEKGIKAKY